MLIFVRLFFSGFVKHTELLINKGKIPTQGGIIKINTYMEILLSNYLRSDVEICLMPILT